MLDAAAQTPLITVLKRAQQLGFIGKKADLNAEITHSLRFGELAFEELPQPHSLTEPACLDLGSGGGLPALVLAAAWRGTLWSLSEISDKRCDFLEWAISHLGLGSEVRILRGSVKELPQSPEHQEAYDLATARAFAPVHKTQAAVVDLLKPGGFLLVSNPPKGRSRQELEGSGRLIPYPARSAEAGTDGNPIELADQGAQSAKIVAGSAEVAGSVKATGPAGQPINISVFQKTP